MSCLLTPDLLLVEQFFSRRRRIDFQRLEREKKRKNNFENNFNFPLPRSRGGEFCNTACRKNNLIGILLESSLLSFKGWSSNEIIFFSNSQQAWRASFSNRGNISISFDHFAENNRRKIIVDLMVQWTSLTSYKREELSRSYFPQGGAHARASCMRACARARVCVSSILRFYERRWKGISRST